MVANQTPNVVTMQANNRGNIFISLLTIFITFLLVATSICNQIGAREKKWWLQQLQTHQEKLDKNIGTKCNFFEGKWVFDNKSHPLYKESNCSFMFDSFACEKYGRKDFMYQNWRWQPHQCQLPRFDAATLLQKLRGKRMVFVGDSLNRNQFVSLVCMVDSSIPPTLKSLQFNGNLIIFKAIEYNASIEFYWSPLLVESNTDDPINHRVEERIAKLDSIEKHAKHWIDAEVLVFDSYIWWLRPKMKVLWGSFGRSDGIYEEMERLKSYEMALNTWANWLICCSRDDRTQFLHGLIPRCFRQS
ncbi:hypothetical protein Leryth_008153 [Lithospermum erythrorhizon]|nr:hypothetical protein Leryth_008153 [Lithospermum erythrorhizon]